jgi:hypothetical protein
MIKDIFINKTFLLFIVTIIFIFTFIYIHTNSYNSLSVAPLFFCITGYILLIVIFIISKRNKWF